MGGAALPLHHQDSPEQTGSCTVAAFFQGSFRFLPHLTSYRCAFHTALTVPSSCMREQRATHRQTDKQTNSPRSFSFDLKDTTTEGTILSLKTATRPDTSIKGGRNERGPQNNKKTTN
mmetsp:Transcript_24110/g.47345  ORF Transcript_24110/g.47345 Transcript_24110/m.47345 type:complete len:118 (+) Transcript_24110:1675-2028(+)